MELVLEAGEPRKAWVRGPAPRFRDLPPTGPWREVLEALGSDERYLHRGLPYGVAFTGLWSLFVPLIAPGVVDALEPEMERLKALCFRLDVATVHAYAPMGPRSFYARDFAPSSASPRTRSRAPPTPPWGPSSPGPGWCRGGRKGPPHRLPGAPPGQPRGGGGPGGVQPHGRALQRPDRGRSGDRPDGGGLSAGKPMVRLVFVDVDGTLVGREGVPPASGPRWRP